MIKEAMAWKASQNDAKKVTASASTGDSATPVAQEETKTAVGSPG